MSSTDKKLSFSEKLYKYGVLYFGTGLMMISPFFIDSVYGKVGMLIALSLITIQTQKTKQYNLSLLNAVGFIGYLYSLIMSLL
jgi:hypothetical protein|tara:strand:- start:3578 stop:3826 length:249 start_codon:yes stop_codon:yes gene_type:complete